MIEKKPSKDLKKPLKPSQYSEPGETSGRKEGLAPTGELLEEVNTKEQEIGGFSEKEPTRYGDWEVKGRCSDF